MIESDSQSGRVTPRHRWSAAALLILVATAVSIAILNKTQLTWLSGFLGQFFGSAAPHGVCGKRGEFTKAGTYGSQEECSLVCKNCVDGESHSLTATWEVDCSGNISVVPEAEADAILGNFPPTPRPPQVRTTHDLGAIRRAAECPFKGDCFCSWS